MFAEAGSIGDSDIRIFTDYVGNSGSDDLRDLITNDTSIDYDIVFVNWDNGTDYLQRNAYVLQAVINWVNSTKVTGTPNVVLGQSMGGVIARYALRDMENRSESHDTDLYISHDAPHQGAHISLGLLYMARHAVDQFIETPLGDFNLPLVETGNVSISSIGDLLEIPAVKQMLINNVNSNLQLDNVEHDTWQSELTLMGYPQQTRNIALSNANHCAETQGLSSNEELLNITFDGNTSGLADIILFATGAGALVGDFFNDTLTFILGFLPGNTKLEADFTVKAYPSSGTAQIYRGKLIYEKTLLWVLPIRRTITDRSFDSPSGVLFYDNYPGGTNPTSIDFVGSGYFDIVIAQFGYSVSFNPNFNFIPTPSALDVGSDNTTLNDSDYLKVYTVASSPTGNKAIPFNNFTTSYNTSNINEPHISFNRRNGDWLAEELDGDANDGFFDCSFVCSNTSVISGISTLCSSGVYNANTTGDAIVNWSVSNSSAVSLSASTDNTVTLTAVGSYRTDIILTANISSSSCAGSVILTKNIRVGAPGTPSSISGPATVNTGALVTYTAGSAAGATSYQWYLPYPYTTVSTFDYFGQDWQLQAPGNTTIADTFTGYAQNAGYVQVMGKNDCGSGGAKLLYVQHQSSGGGSSGGPKSGGGGIPRTDPTDDVKEVSLYPNPAKNKVTVSLTHLTEYEGEPPTVIYGIKIFDLNLIERRFYEFKKFNNQEEINVAFLSTGLYTLIVYTDTATFTKKLLIK